MFSKIMGIVKYIYYSFYAKLNPNKYAKHLGVILGRNIVFYAMRPGMFSTES